ncbi:MAG: MaoC family dehydratase [Betaproteobacteria bacterium]|nr:MAG: MaoC family dehydratase [Betaproteobacteria bacterium]
MDRYFDDFEVGERFRSRGATMTETDIINYALAYDPQPFHIDAEAAAKSAYGGLIASGQHTFGIGWRMFLQEGLFKACSMGSPGVDELRWTAPVRPGDTIYTEAEVLEIRPSGSKPDRGILRMGYRMVNQRDETVLTMSIVHILAKRPE